MHIWFSPEDPKLIQHNQLI